MAQIYDSNGQNGSFRCWQTVPLLVALRLWASVLWVVIAPGLSHEVAAACSRGRQPAVLVEIYRQKPRSGDSTRCRRLLSPLRAAP